MCMSNAADVFPMFIKNSVCSCIRRRTKFSFYNIAIKINDNHFLRGKLVIRNSAWFYSKYIEFSVRSTYITECKNYKAQFRQLHIGVVSNLFEMLVFTHE